MEDRDIVDALVATVLDAARVIMDQGLWYEAQGFVQRVLDVVPDQPEALALSAQIAERQGTHEATALLARHLRAAGNLDDAAAALLTAGALATDVGALDDALQHLSEAREVIDDLSSRVARRLELTWCIQMGTLSAATYSYARYEAERGFERALQLCDLIASSGQEGGPPDLQLIAALGGLWSAKLVAGDLPAARAVSDRLEKVLVELPDTAIQPQLQRFVHGTRAFAALYAGDTTGALEALAAAEACAVPDSVTIPLGVPHDYLAAEQALLSSARRVAGDDEGADAALERALERARSVRAPIGPFSEAIVNVYASYGYRTKGDMAAAIATAQQVGVIGDTHGFQEQSTLSQVLELAARVMGEDREACEGLDASLEMWRAIGGGIGLPLLCTELAEGWLRAGDIEPARRALAAAVEQAEWSDQHGIDSEVIRIGALLDRATGAPREEVAAALTRAEAMARAGGSTRLADRAARDRALLDAP